MLTFCRAGGGNRTHTPLAGPRILSPVRLPVPPPRPEGLSITRARTYRRCRLDHADQLQATGGPRRNSLFHGAEFDDPNEVEGLIPDYITTQAELNALERENITEATTWAESRRHSDILTATFTFDIHKRMLNRDWKWAGKQRTWCALPSSTGDDSRLCERQRSARAHHDEHPHAFKRARIVFLGNENAHRSIGS